ncbi:MAG: PorT family protein [Chitinophagaceae bacterium]|nr:PorT family protein [Chitinophagaceae bacterium]
MKKLFSLIVIVSISTAAIAQIGITAGVTVATLKLKENIPGISIDSKVGFTLGVFTHIPLSTNFIFRPGLNFTQKGAKLSDASDEIKTTLNYLELPLDFIYKTNGGFFVGVGPSLAYLLSGKSKYSDGSPDYKLQIGSDENNDDIKPFEFSGNLLAGYELSNGIFFSVNYNLGFSNLSPSSSSSDDYKNGYFGIKVGKKFGTVKK